MPAVRVKSSLLEQLFADNNLPCPKWILDIETLIKTKKKSGKQARYAVYNVIVKKLQEKKIVGFGTTVVYPKQLVETLSKMFPDGNIHKDYGLPTITLAQISQIQ